MNNLIGISGKIGSGKDTVGKILCYLSSQQRLYKNWKHLENIEFDHTILQFLNNETPASYLYDDVFKIKKYADKLKDIVCLLIGCTRADLESHEFKDKELGEEWWRYQIIWDSKPALNTHLHLNKWEAERSAKMFAQIHGTYKIELIKLTPRLLLQLLGTDCGRDIIHPNIWVNALFADYKQDLYIKTNHPISEELDVKYPNWIITDVRFPNEAQAIKDRGGIVIRVNRDVPKVVGVNFTLKDGSTKFVKSIEHPSETALDNYEFDAVLNNDGSIEELIEKVKQLKLV